MPENIIYRIEDLTPCRLFLEPTKVLRAYLETEKGRWVLKKLTDSKKAHVYVISDKYRNDESCTGSEQEFRDISDDIDTLGLIYDEGLEVNPRVTEAVKQIFPNFKRMPGADAYMFAYARMRNWEIILGVDVDEGVFQKMEHTYRTLFYPVDLLLHHEIIDIREAIDIVEDITQYSSFFFRQYADEFMDRHRFDPDFPELV